VVGRSLPFQRTTELAKKFWPFTNNWPFTNGLRTCSPSGAQLGLRELIVGTGLGPLVMVKFIALEMPPPCAALVTVTVSVPVEAMAAAGMAAVNCVALTNVVLRTVPPKLTIEAATKFVPLIVSVKPAPPAMALLGEIVVIVGVGLVLTVEVVPPPHPARNERLTIPKIASILMSTVWLFMTSSSIRAMP